MMLSETPTDSEAVRVAMIVSLSEHLRRCDAENWLEAGIFIERAVSALSYKDGEA